MNNSKGSILAVSLIILGMILIIAMGVSTVSMRERKSSSGSAKSSTAYQNADTGAEKVLNQIIKKSTPTDSVQAMSSNIPGTYCNSDGLIEEDVTGKFKVELKDVNEARIFCNNASALVSSIASVKSTGISGEENRAIEATLVPNP